MGMAKTEKGHGNGVIDYFCKYSIRICLILLVYNAVAGIVTETLKEI